jgi:hypothetical protein
MIIRRSLIRAAVLCTLPLLAPLAYGEEFKPVAAPPVPVTAVKAAKAPILEARGDDAVWKQAAAVSLEAIKGVNFKDNLGTTHATVQAAYDSSNIYFLVTWEDPTLSVRRAPYVKQADGTWLKLADPGDKGGDNTKYYEDKFAMMWNINNSILGFNEKFGCQAACHAGEPGKPYGNKYTEEEGEIGDLWHMKYVRGAFLGQMDDQWVDNTRFNAAAAPEAGRKSDPDTGGGYKDVKLVDGKPEFMSRDAKAANKGGAYWIRAEDKVPFDDSRFVPGDEVASIVVAPFTGDRGDIKVSAAWKDGRWVAAVARKLVTGSKYDVQFDDLSKTYGFGMSFFDNAQVRHAFVPAPLILSFEK